MHISLNKNGDIQLHQQLAEQIVFLISTGKLKADQQLPSVRSLARQLEIHHNTVSRAYRELVQRGWLRRQPGTRLYVGDRPLAKSNDATLDGLIDQAIQRAREKGHSLKSLRERVLKRLSQESPDHILVVEDELELGRIIKTEILSIIDKRVEVCTVEEFLKSSHLAVGAQVVAADYVLRTLRELAPTCNGSHMSLMFSPANEHITFIRKLKQPSIIGIASVSRTFLKTAQALLASIIGDRHTLKEFLLPLPSSINLKGIDVMFCDSVGMPTLHCRCKIHYRLIATGCLEDLSTLFESPIRESTSPIRTKQARQSRKNR